MGGFYPKFPDPKPGPQTGSERPVNAPNNGSQGGRPTVSGVVSASPFERLLSEIAPLPPPSAGPATAPPQNAGGEMWPDVAAPGGGGAPANPTTQVAPPSPGGPTININVGGQPAPTTPQPASPAGQAAQPATSAAAPGAEAVQPTVPGTADGTMPPAAPPKPAPVSFPRQPRVDELAGIPDGTEIITPYGVGTKQYGEVSEYRLTPAGQEAHKRATLQARQRFGRTPFDGDGGPELPIVIGGYNFNPWAPAGSEWTKG